MNPIANAFGPITLPPTDPRYVDGGPGGEVPSVSGMKLDQARQRLRDAGFQVADKTTPVNSNAAKGSVVGTTPSGRTIPGTLITINTSSGCLPPPAPVYAPRLAPPAQQPPSPPMRSELGPPPPPDVVEIPGLPPITLADAAPPP